MRDERMDSCWACLAFNEEARGRSWEVEVRSSESLNLGVDDEVPTPELWGSGEVEGPGSIVQLL